LSPAVAGSVRDALSAAADALAAAGCESPRLDAELLLAEATGRDRAALAGRPEAEVESAAARSFGAMVRRRVAREPIAYILGKKGFRRIELAVDKRVLIPRPETELLVEVALGFAPATVLDVGTGSGAVALAVADELGVAEVVATDTSLDALAVAKGNADRLGLSDRIRFEHGSAPADFSVGFELVLANLPYVGEGEWAGLAAEIRLYEPREALTPGLTGLEAIEALLEAVAGGELRTDAVALEVGERQATTVGGLMRRTGFERVEVRRDLAGIERVVIGRR
jgi:release factor glutamine methyltransferase